MFKRKYINYLKKWKEKPNRKPLVLRGARQVGKTSLIQSFSQEFDDFLHINLEKKDMYEYFKEVKTVEDFQKVVDIVLRKKIYPRKTLIFIDEIQALPHMISLLRFFYEERPEWYVVVAGSLLEAAITRLGLEMPVGRIEYLYMYPLNFFEFLEFLSEHELLEHLTHFSLHDTVIQPIHQKALNAFYEYTFIGGMPEIVTTYAQNKNYENLVPLYSSMQTTYSEDVLKYETLASSKYVQYVIEQAPLFAGSVVTYEKFGTSKRYRSREMSEAFSSLQKVMLLYETPATQSKKLPLVPKLKRPKKLLYLDVGLVNFKNNIRRDFLNIQDLQDVYQGRVAEQVVGQNILALYQHRPPELLYWAKQKEKGSAEVDFCFSWHGRVVGVEVKSGTTARLRSLVSFANEVENSILVRIDNGFPRLETIEYMNQKYQLLSLPYYLLPRLWELLEECIAM